jgi:hypothetical protein
MSPSVCSSSAQSAGSSTSVAGQDVRVTTPSGGTTRASDSSRTVSPISNGAG